MDSEISDFRRATILEEDHAVYLNDECACKPPEKDNASEDSKVEKDPCWSHPLEFSLGFCATLFRNSGLYLFLSFCCKYGGMSFTAAYAIVMAVVGLPTVVIVVAIGQYSKHGPLKCWEFYPTLGGLGLSMMLISGLYRAPNLVVASESIYLATMLVESAKLPNRDGNATENRCKSPLLSGFCRHVIRSNISRSDCSGLGLTVDMPEWGICGQLDKARTELSPLKDPIHHYLWKEVAVYDGVKAMENFAREKLLATDLLTGKMRRGFRANKSLTKSLHWTLVTFVFTLSYCGLLVILMVEESVLLTVLHTIGAVSSGCVIALNLAAVLFVNNVKAINEGWYLFGQSSVNSGFLSQPSIWVDALLLTLWNTGCCSGILIHLAKRNSFGHEYIGTCLLQTVFHCLLYGLVAVSFNIVRAHAISVEGDTDEASGFCMLCSSFGYTHVLMELQPSTLLLINHTLSILPLVCFAIGELTAFASFSICLVSSVLDYCKKRLKKHSGQLHLVLFVLSLLFFLPLCFQFGGAVVYDYLRSAWGWNAVLLMAVQLVALWSFVRPGGIPIFFKFLGIGNQLSRLSFWWRLCWFGYTPLMLTFALALLALDFVRQPGIAPKGANHLWKAGPLHALTEAQMQGALLDWWIIDLVRAATLLPLLLLLLLGCRGGCNEDSPNVWHELRVELDAAR